MGAAPRRLFCLPSAGGGATAFMPLLTLDDETTEICPVALPAREHRFSEPLPKSMNNLADQMATELSPLLDRPYAILGYSMGALLGCELIRRWREAGCAEPEMFIALAARAPHLPLEDRPPLHHLEGDDFREALIELGGTPRELLDNREAMSLFEPILRGDLKNCETHAYRSMAPLTGSIHAYVGEHDTLVTRAAAAAWESYTLNAFELHSLPTGHLIARGALTDLGAQMLKLWP